MIFLRVPRIYLLFRAPKSQKFGHFERMQGGGTWCNLGLLKIFMLMAAAKYDSNSVLRFLSGPYTATAHSRATHLSFFKKIQDLLFFARRKERERVALKIRYEF